MATNRFYVQPLGGANIGQNLIGLAGLIQDRRRQEAEAARTQAEEQRLQQEQARTQAGRAAAVEAYRSRDPQRIAQVMLEYPEVQKSMSAAIGFRDETTRKNAADTYLSILRFPERTEEFLQRRADYLESIGADSSETRREILAYRENPDAYPEMAAVGYATVATPEEYKAYQAATGRGGTGQASAKTEIYKDGTTIQAMPTGQVVVRNPAGEVVTGQERLDTLRGARQSGLARRQREADISVEAELRKARGRADILAETEPARAAAVERAVGEEKARQAGAETAQKQRVALATYDTAMSNLMNALSATEPGAIAGRISMTEAQQTADAAEKVASSSLKAIFRQAGEGTFTDQDQVMLEGLLPKRTQLRAVRQANARMLDDIVRAKMGGDTRSAEQIMRDMESRGQEGQAPTAQSLPPQNAQGWRLMVDANGNRAYVGPNGQIQEVP